MRHPDELTEEFRRRGLKATPQRTAVFRALQGDQSHPTAEAVHRRVVRDMPTVSLRTVYQALNDLAAMGEIRHLEVGTGSARFDPNVETAHDHAVCDACGSVRDVPAAEPSVDPRDLPEGFEARVAEVVVRGTCASCAGSAERSTVAPARA